MHTAKIAAAPPSAVPMLDVNRENARLAPQIEDAMAEVTRSGAFVHGPACQKFEAEAAAYCGAKHAIGCASGSDALILALMALEIGPGDEVIMPSFTFFATASAVWRLGAKPVFADIKADTFNLDPADVLYKITTATKAIIPVHLFGQCAEMNEIRQIATAARGIPIIEDSCQAIGAEYHGKRTGALGSTACFSFYPTKNLGGFGDGGLITTDDDEQAAQIRVLRDHGMKPRYYHHFVGINSRLDALQAAVLSVKLPHLDSWTAARKEHAERYHREFKNRGVGGEIVAPTVAERLDACVEPVHRAREKWSPRRTTEAPGRPQNRRGDLLSGAAASAEVFWRARLRRRQLAGDRAGLPRSLVTARLPGALSRRAGRRHRRDRGILPEQRSGSSVIRVSNSEWGMGIIVFHIPHSQLHTRCYSSCGFLKSVVRFDGESVTNRPKIVMKPTIAQHIGMLGPLGPAAASADFLAARSKNSDMVSLGRLIGNRRGCDCATLPILDGRAAPANRRRRSAP